MKDIFFHERGKQILLSLAAKRKYVSEVAHDTGATYAHTFNLIKYMEVMGIAKTTKVGRTKNVQLTPKGRRLARAMNAFCDILSAARPRFKAEARTKKTGTGETMIHKKLRAYAKALADLEKKLRSKKFKPGDFPKHSRLCGRYRYLVLRQRPRDEAAKGLKREALASLERIRPLLEARKS